MRNYWSCSKFADWLRGTKKPFSLELGKWDNWQAEAKKKHPIRYWLAEEGLDRIQKIVTYPSKVYNDVVYYINNRWITKTHALTSNMKKGDYYDFDTRIIECLFDELVNFVEVELAWNHVVWSGEKKTPWWRRTFRFRTWRSPKDGIAYLEWESALKNDEDWVEKDHPDYGKPTHQAVNAAEKLVLYNWWKQRNSRPDPIVVSGWSDYCKRNPRPLRIGGAEDEGRKILNRCNEIEKQYDDEDTEMLIRLIKIRKSLWI